MTTPVRLPDSASLQAALAGLDPASADADLVPALAAAFAGFDFGLAHVDDDYWRDTRSVIRPDGTRVGELRPWMTAELAKDGGDVKATWARLKDSDLQITEWRGSSAFVFAPTGTAPADYVQIALGREVEWRAGPIVNPDYRPWGEEELLDPGWPRDKPLPDTDRLAGRGVKTKSVRPSRIAPSPRSRGFQRRSSATELSIDAPGDWGSWHTGAKFSG